MRVSRWQENNVIRPIDRLIILKGPCNNAAYYHVHYYIHERILFVREPVSIYAISITRLPYMLFVQPNMSLLKLSTVSFQFLNLQSYFCNYTICFVQLVRGNGKGLVKLGLATYSA